MEELPDDETHFDGCYIGRDVPKSVFFRSIRQRSCLGFLKPHELAGKVEAQRLYEMERNRQGQVDRLREKRRQRPGFTKARKP